jgi:EmrB/QacA subfamily drug resistance transporter
LAVVATAFFMTILDVSIVNVALPSIARSLDFSQENLQWVITAYAITFGGFLLLGGRAADLIGRRSVFMVGVALFTIASLVCGLAQSEGMLIASRAVQGLGGAIISPAALSIVMTSFEEGPDRNKALGVWGALGGSGAAVGVLAGGVLTEYLSWRWIFFVNVPIGALVLLLTPRIVPESRREGVERHYDALGAVLVSSGLALLVYAISEAPNKGWGSARTIVLLVGAGVLLVGFLINERRIEDPLMPFHIFRVRTVAGANAVGFLLGGVLFANFFVLTLYVQDVLGYSAIKTGVTFVATAGTAVLAAGAAQALTTKFGPKPIICIGLTLLVAGMIFYAQIPVHGSFASNLLPGYVLVGVGIAFAYVPVSIASLAGVAEHEAGLASGLINTSQQIGGAIGTAIASTIFISHFKSLRIEGKPPLEALTGGYSWAFWGLAVIGVLALIAALTLIRREELADVPAGAPIG